MDQTNIRKTVTTQNLGNAQIADEQVSTSTTVDSQEFSLAKGNQVIWFIGHFIAVILALRFVFLLLGARLTGIVLLIYNISSVLVVPFRGIFPSATTGVSFFDTSALVGIVMYYLIVILITKILMLMSKNVDA